MVAPHTKPPRDRTQPLPFAIQDERADFDWLATEPRRPCLDSGNAAQPKPVFSFYS